MMTFLSLMLDKQIEKRDERGATAVEYGLMVALIAVAIIATVLLLGGKLKDLFQTIANAI